MSSVNETRLDAGLLVGFSVFAKLTRVCMRTMLVKVKLYQVSVFPNKSRLWWTMSSRGLTRFQFQTSR